MNTTLCSILALCLAGCTQTSEPQSTVPRPTATSPATPAVTTASGAAVTLPDDFAVTRAFVFIPQWEGADGFSAGGKYVIQGDGFSDDRSTLSAGLQIHGLAQDGRGQVAFTVVGESIKADNVEVQAVNHNGEKFSGTEVNILILKPSASGPNSPGYDPARAKLIKQIPDSVRPEGEANHQLSLGIDLNGDGHPEYAEFSHHCKAEQAPYPIDDAGRAAWETKAGEVDWDYTSSNTYTRRQGSWVKGDRQTPM